MKLEDAKSKEEVAAALAAGDEEMRESVDAFLEEARDSFLGSEDHYGEEQDPFGFEFSLKSGLSDVVNDNEAFLNQVIQESAGTGFDLSKVPVEIVKKNLKYTCSGEPSRDGRLSHWGPFAVNFPNDRDSPSLEWSYYLTGTRSVRFDDRHFPDAELAALVPEEQAKAFWKDLEVELSSWKARREKTTDFEWQESTSYLGENYGYGEGEDYGLGPYDEEKFTEWCRDIVSEHINKIVNSDPKAAYEMFLASAELPAGVQALLDKAKELDGDDFPNEEIMDFVVKFFEAEDEDHRSDEVKELDNYLIKTYAPDSLVPDFLAAAETWMDRLSNLGREGIMSPEAASLRDNWNDARAEGFFTKEGIEALAGDWLDQGRAFEQRGDGVGSEILEELKRYRFEKNPGPAVETFVKEVTEALAKTSVGQAGADVVRKAIEEKHFSKKNVLEMAFNWSKGQKRNVTNDLEDYADAIMKGEQIPEQATVATISKEDIAKLGITQTYLAEEAPFKLIKLRPQDLAAEGRRMRHCVGDSPKYARELAAGDIEVWSLRDRSNKPYFTLEVKTGIHNYGPDAAEIDDEGTDSHKWAKERAKFVEQLKGKANRTPGYDERSSRGVTKPEEVIFWRWLLKKLKIHPEYVRDFSGLKAMPQLRHVAASVAATPRRAVSAQRISAGLDAIAEAMRARGINSRLLAAVEDAAFYLAE